MKTFVYQVTNRNNGKTYIGKAVDVDARWYKHCWAARNTKKPFPFLRAIRKHGPAAFSVEVLGVFASDADAGIEEQQRIAARDPKRSYNVACGGTGGHTMLPHQLEAQYAIASAGYAEFKRLFDAGLTVSELGRHFSVSPRAVNSCSRRLGLSFSQRSWWAHTLASIRKLAGIDPKRLVAYTYKALSPEARHRIHSETAHRVNQARRVPVDVQQSVLRLYLEEDLTAQQVAARLGLTKGTVRGTINRAYAAMAPDERTRWKSRHGSAVRTGDRNSNYQGLSDA